MVQVPEIPGMPALTGMALFGAGAVGLLACGTFLVVRYRRTREERGVHSAAEYLRRSAPKNGLGKKR
jgi:Na+/proline symporter